MLLDANKGKADILLVWRNDRLFRSLMSARTSMSSSSSTRRLILCGAFPTAASCWPPIYVVRSGRSTPMPYGCSASHRDTGPCASYALSGPRTPVRADLARACLSPGLISEPRTSMRAVKRRARLISLPGLGKEEGRETGSLRESATRPPCGATLGLSSWCER
jgi:hypothetical protein